MPLLDINKEEQDVVAQCLRAAVDGLFFNDVEFYTLFCVSREEAKIVAGGFPNTANTMTNAKAATTWGW